MRHYVPELRHLPGAAAHRPWETADGYAHGYPERIVDHAAERVEALARLIPGVVGNPESLVEESHSADSGGLLEYPVYTKPAAWRGLEVPEILLSGHHAAISAWRRDRALERTHLRRPDLLGDADAWPDPEMRHRH